METLNEAILNAELAGFDLVKLFWTWVRGCHCYYVVLSRVSFLRLSNLCSAY
jgi:hypothetical protein